MLPLILLYIPKGCAQSLRKWLHNNLISIVGICLGIGLLEVI
jgi:CD37 antigen